MPGDAPRAPPAGVMLYLQGHSVAETGSLLACDRRKAENLTYRGLADLRSCLSSQGIES